MGYKEASKNKIIKKTYAYKRKNSYKCRCSYCIDGKSHSSTLNKLKADSSLEDLD